MSRGQSLVDTQRQHAPAHPFCPETKFGASTIQASSRGTLLSQGHSPVDTQ